MSIDENNQDQGQRPEGKPESPRRWAEDCLVYRARSHDSPAGDYSPIPPSPFRSILPHTISSKARRLLARLDATLSNFMLSASAVEVTFGDDEWVDPPVGSGLYGAASVGNSWGVTSIGRGFDWRKTKDQAESPVPDSDLHCERDDSDYSYFFQHDTTVELPPMSRPHTCVTPVSDHSHSPLVLSSASLVSEPSSISPSQSPLASPRITPSSSRVSLATTHRPPLSRSSTSPRPRRRSSQQRVSLIAGRVSIAPMEHPDPPPVLSPSLHRTGSSNSLLSIATSAGPPTPAAERESFLGGRTISEFTIEAELGRGAYGLVKRAREINDDGSLGPPLVIKQVIKSRILADCWKRHPKHGTIPIEIYVMSAISSTSYVLPPRRPWDPSRFPAFQANGPDILDTSKFETVNDDSWAEGKMVKGHPNICPLLDFFEDNHYYYLVLPSTLPEQKPDESTPSDLFDLVENYPQGLPPSSVRTYLGQIADALCFLHSHGIVHRDIKDENVILGPDGKCILIDFGSSGLVRKGGWDTFSGTLDYAGPEILRGERYHGKEQDVWAFGVVAYVLIVGECPFMTAAEAQDGLESPFADASIALDERCADGREHVGLEADGGGALGDVAALIRACLRVDLGARPTFERILQCRFLAGGKGWGMEGS